MIGGGNVAFDVSRSAVRYADDDSERLVARQTETDISRVALRQAAVREVHLACLESREEMPADEVEIVEGEEEGIVRHNRLGPKEFLFREENGQKLVAGVRFRRVLSVFDANRRFAPVYDDSETVDVEADTVLLSVGQMPDLSFLGDVSRLQVDPETCETGTPGVFAAGDVAYGARLMIDAIASGKKAARGVYRFLTGREIRQHETQLHVEIEDYHREAGYEGRRRAHIPVASAQERLADPKRLVETGYTEVQAAGEAGRCLDCGVNTIFDGEKCILCGGMRRRLPHAVPETGGAGATGPLARDRCAARRKCSWSGRLRDSERRGSLYPLRPVRRALPHARHHDGAIPVPPGVDLCLILETTRFSGPDRFMERGDRHGNRARRA